MKPEELKQLKQGDEIFIRARYKYIDTDGDVRFYLSVTSVFGGEAKGEGHTLPENVILPSELQPAPKYDPCRKFRKGDRVRVVEWSGRNPVLPFMDCKVGDIGTVIKDEETTSFFVRLHLEGKYEKDMPYCHLELITPVEELEPYRVETGGYNRWSVKKGDLFHSQYPFGEHCVFNMNEAKAAAEAECARLNAEHRKEQNNGMGH